MATLGSLVLLAAPTLATADWLSLRSTNFHVIGDVSAGQLRSVALSLEQFREVVGLLNPAAAGDEDSPPVVVLVFRDTRSYEPFMPLADGRPVGVSGFFQGGPDVNYITLTLEAGPDAFPTIFHEYSHMLLRRTFADAPVWFHEGLAEYYSTFEVAGNGQSANIGKPVNAHVSLLRRRRLPFARFFAIDRDAPEYTRNIIERDVFYAQSWAIVHHAFHGQSKRREQLLDFARQVAAGAAMESTFREVYGTDLRDLEREVRLYLNNFIYEYDLIELSDSIVTRIDPDVTSISDAEADAWLGDLLAHMDRLDEASARLELALEEDPDLALAHASLGALRLKQERHAEGMAHLEQAFELETNNEAALFSYAYALASQRLQDRDWIPRATSALERAVQLRPGYTEAKLLLGYVHLVNGANQAVRDVLAPLVRAEPTNHRAALRLADALLRMDDIDGARTLLGQVLARTANEDERERARTLLGEVAGRQIRRDTRNAAGLDPAGEPALAGSSSSSESRPPGSVFITVFRDVGPDEERIYGILESVECANFRVAFRVRTADAVLRIQALRLRDVEFIAYRPLDATAIRCGPRAAPEEIYLTWRVASDVPGADENTAVAIEILPDGFVPQP